MLFKRRAWLWLCLSTSFLLASELSSPEHRGKGYCYQLHRFHCSFQDAENYCRARGGHLAYTWNQEVQDLIWDFLEEGKKWWTGQNLMLLGKDQENSHPSEALRFDVYEGNLLTFRNGRKKQFKSFCFCIQKNQSFYSLPSLL